MGHLYYLQIVMIQLQEASLVFKKYSFSQCMTDRWHISLDQHFSDFFAIGLQSETQILLHCKPQ